MTVSSGLKMGKSLTPDNLAYFLKERTHFVATSGKGLDSIASLALHTRNLPPTPTKTTNSTILIITIANALSIGENEEERARAEPFLSWGREAIQSGFVIDPRDARHTSTRCVFHKPRSRKTAFVCLDHIELPFIIGWSEQRGYTFMFNLEDYPLVNPSQL